MTHLITSLKQTLKPLNNPVYLLGVTLVGLFLIIVYIWQINSISTVGYKLRELESTKSQFQKNNNELQIKITEASSTPNVLKKLEDIKMVPVGSISYLNTNEADVALAR